jgi:hypothetical protein
MSRRINEGNFSVGEFHFLPNTLHGIGAETELHAHAFDHVALFLPGESGFERYGVYAENGNSVIEREFSGHQFALVRAGVRHRIKLLSGDRGAFICMFSRFGANGEVRVTPDG